MRRKGRDIIKVLSVIAGITFFCIVLTLIKKHDRECRARMEYYQEIAVTERQWILDSQTPGGAFVLYGGKGTGENGAEGLYVNPYFANIAGMSLLEGEPGKRECLAVRRYLDWYLEHLNTAASDKRNGAGTIYDHIIYFTEVGTENAVSQDTCDSVDSYAGTFLCLAARYLQKTGDQEWAKEKEKELCAVMEALMGCLDNSGRAYAKKDYPVQYLMDNCEVNAGLKSGLFILENISADSDSIYSMQMWLEKNSRQLEEFFWNKSEQRYEIGFTKDGETLPFQGWEHLYPDAAAQLFPLAFAVTDAQDEKAERAYREFCRHWEWENMCYMATGESGSLWPVFACVGARMSDVERVETYFIKYEEYVYQNGRSYPYHVDDAGWMHMAAYEMSCFYRDKIIIPRGESYE